MPQQNGVVERKNKTIMEMAHIMLTDKHLSNEYWVEAVATAVYILNICPTKSVRNKVPRESWIFMKHNVVHFKVFGCVTYTHVLYEMRNVFWLGIMKTQKNTSCMILLEENS